jgi:hypothetical protein
MWGLMLCSCYPGRVCAAGIAGPGVQGGGLMLISCRCAFYAVAAAAAAAAACDVWLSLHMHMQG